MIKCLICEKELVSIKALSQHILNHNITSKYYYDKFLLNDENEKFCKECGKETKFLSLTKGYQKFCCLKCSNNNEHRKELFRESWTKEKLEKAKEKREETNLERYGDIYANRSDVIKEKTKQIFIEKFDIDNPMKLKEFNQKAGETKRNRMISDVVKTVLESQNLTIEPEYCGAHLEYKFHCKKCGNTFKTIWNYVQQGKKCPTCFPSLSGKSAVESEIANFLKEIGIKSMIRNSKKIIKPKELDIYLPDKKVAIEYNGLYFHSDEFYDDKYHIDKTERCLKKGIMLVQIFEDEWLFKQTIVKERLKQILGLSDSIKINARDCVIKEIDSKIKNDFLFKYHLQGKDSSAIKLGAFYNNVLVSVMTFSHGNISKGSKYNESTWELNRFCSNYKYRIVGIASKLLEHFKRNFSWSKIFSYADRRWSIGNLYYKIGFDLESISKPNYWYIKNYKRIHRFNLRKTNVDPKDIPEYVLRQNEGYSRIWDCGNYKFSLIKQEEKI